LIRCEKISAFRKNEYKQDLGSDYSDRIITSPFPIAYPVEYSIIKIIRFSSLRTTMIYTHVACKNLMGVKNPLDQL
jgi:hypothetical protein